MKRGERRSTTRLGWARAMGVYVRAYKCAVPRALPGGGCACDDDERPTGNVPLGGRGIPCMLRDHERAASGRERNNQPWTRDPMMGAMAASMFSVLTYTAPTARPYDNGCCNAACMTMARAVFVATCSLSKKLLFVVCICSHDLQLFTNRRGERRCVARRRVRARR